MTPDELMEKWRRRQAEHARLGSLVPIAAIAAEVLEDLASIATFTGEGTVTPAEAARACGYHEESIHRMIRAKRLTNYGTPRRPRVRLSECPRKAGAPAVANRDREQTSSPPASELALDVLASRRTRNRPPRSA